MKHELKTDEAVFKAVAAGLKTFEIRKNDRNFQTGDLLELRCTQYTGEEMREGKPLKYLGQHLYAEVTYILRGPIYGLLSDWVIMSITPADKTR